MTPALPTPWLHRFAAAFQPFSAGNMAGMKRITLSLLAATVLTAAAGLAWIAQAPERVAEKSDAPTPLMASGQARLYDTGSDAKAALDQITAAQGVQALSFAELITSDGEQFLLEREAGPYARLVFPETGRALDLREDSGNGGDVVFKTPEGQTMLRLTRRGNAILYDDEAALGRPVDLVQQDHRSRESTGDG